MQFPVAGKLRAGAHAFADVHGGAAAVFEDRPPGKDRGQDAVEERQAELRRRVFQVYTARMVWPRETGSAEGGGSFSTSQPR